MRAAVGGDGAGSIRLVGFYGTASLALDRPVFGEGIRMSRALPHVAGMGRRSGSLGRTPTRARPAHAAECPSDDRRRMEGAGHVNRPTYHLRVGDCLGGMEALAIHTPRISPPASGPSVASTVSSGASSRADAGLCCRGGEIRPSGARHQKPCRAAVRKFPEE